MATERNGAQDHPIALNAMVNALSENLKHKLGGAMFGFLLGLKCYLSKAVKIYHNLLPLCPSLINHRCHFQAADFSFNALTMKHRHTNADDIHTLKAILIIRGLKNIKFLKTFCKNIPNFFLSSIPLLSQCGSCCKVDFTEADPMTSFGLFDTNALFYLSLWFIPSLPIGTISSILP